MYLIYSDELGFQEFERLPKNIPVNSYLAVVHTRTSFKGRWEVRLKHGWEYVEVAWLPPKLKLRALLLGITL